jgi:hypothetical protein
MCFTFAVPTGAQAPVVDGGDHMSLVIAVIVLVIAITGVSVIRRVAGLLRNGNRQRLEPFRARRERASM